MSRIYEIPYIEVIKLNEESVIVTSGGMTPGGEGGNNPGGTTPWTFG